MSEIDELGYLKFNSAEELEKLATECGFEKGEELLSYLSMEYDELVGKMFTFWGARVHVEVV